MRQCQPFRGSEEMVEPSDPVVSQAGPTAGGTDIFIKSIGIGRGTALTPSVLQEQTPFSKKFLVFWNLAIRQQ